MTGKKRRIRDKARQTETYYQAGEAVADEVAEAYLAAYRSLQAEAERVFQNFAGAFNLSQAEAWRLLNDYPDADARALLRRAAEAMPEGPEKERALAEISAPAYQYRIRRIETLQDQAEARLAAVARQEAKLAKAHYTRVIEDSYLYGVYDVQRAAGVPFPCPVRPGGKRDGQRPVAEAGGHLFGGGLEGYGGHCAADPAGCGAGRHDRASGAPGHRADRGGFPGAGL